ncbi:endopeptidase La [Candidatus Gottesmanbacteria bacterium]|nr:endopeptidase La [Candidatus Gottesmanbacteria bacterium]
MPILLSQQPKEKKMPVIPLRDGVVFPGTEAVLTFGRARSLAAIEAAFAKDKLIVITMQKSPVVADPLASDLHTIGTVCQIDRMLKADGEINALVKGLYRVKIKLFDEGTSYLSAQVSEYPDDTTNITEEITALSNHIINQLRYAVNLGKSVDFLAFMNIMSKNDPGSLANQVAAVLEIKATERQEVLETINVNKRLELVSSYITKETKVLELEKKIASKTQEQFNKSIRDTVLRERIKTIEKELGEDSEENREVRELLDKIRKAKMPEDVDKKAKKELKKLSQMSSYNPEASYVRSYLDWLVEVPWSVESPNNVDMQEAEKILNEDHFGLKKIKERILEYLAVMKLKNEKIKNTQNNAKDAPKKTVNAPTILCFVGPPGVGKTSIGKSIAKALGRKFIKISLGGLRDEAEIRGHRRTYVGALPGRIIQGIKQAGTKNPVFMLDEIDKVGSDFRGDPSAALLEALDPEQNFAFSDHYLDVPFDLSGVMFITTCNILDTIPPALRDRLEIIHFAGYTEDEKFAIAKNYLIDKQIEMHGLSDINIKIDDNALKLIIRRYTREAGVRTLEREIARVCRKIARNIATKKQEKVTVKVSDISTYLGPYKFSSYLAEKKDEIGMSTGLAWTEAGGEILFIEVALMPGRGNLTLTGQLGNVMKESCQAALSYVRSRAGAFGLSDRFYQKLDIHVHVPEGAVPKDGPSAGIAITTALVSALTKIPVRKDVGMTGEVTLRGRALEIGGIKEKVIAAHRAGIKKIILPKENKKDLEEIPDYITKDLKFVFVDHMDQVLNEAMVKIPKLIIPKPVHIPLIKESIN